MPVQILEANPRRSFGEKLSLGVGRGLSAAQELMQQQQQLQEQQRRGAQAQQLFGQDISAFDPETQRALLVQKMKEDAEKKTFLQDLNVEQESYNTIANQFGKEFADVWKATPIGGRTALMQAAIDASARGMNIQEIFKGLQKQPPGTQPSAQPAKEPKVEEEWPDFTQRPVGYTPKEWANTRKEWRKENAPIFQQVRDKTKALSDDLRDVKSLTNINESKKLPEGFARLIINPETGEPYGAAQVVGLASPEAQQWVKIIARFQNRAKDAYGSRVTNFDLVQFMKQFPGLLNTKEGRERILKMVDINFKLDHLYNESLKKVYTKYGLGNIPQEEAERLAEEKIKDKADALEKEYMALTEPEERVVDVIGPDGEYTVKESEVEMLPEGYRLK